MPLEELLEYLQTRAGDALRVISWYSDDDWGTLFVRDDLDRDNVEDRVDYSSHQLSNRRRSWRGDPLAELGDEQAMVQVREKAVIIHFPMEGEGGIFVSLDTDVARDLHGFVVDCAEKLAGGDLASRRARWRRERRRGSITLGTEYALSLARSFH